ncbi:MAG: hypothetical protein QNL01_05185 [Akkermansiaceae bacterium]
MRRLRHSADGWVEQVAIQPVDAVARDDSCGAEDSATVKQQHRDPTVGKLHRVFFAQRKEGCRGGSYRRQNGIEMGEVGTRRQVPHSLGRRKADVVIGVRQQGYKNPGGTGIADLAQSEAGTGPRAAGGVTGRVVSQVGDLTQLGATDAICSEFLSGLEANQRRPISKIGNQLAVAARVHIVVLGLNRFGDVGAGQQVRNLALAGDAQLPVRKRVSQQGGRAHFKRVIGIVVWATRRSLAVETVIHKASVPAAVQIEHPADPAEVGRRSFLPALCRAQGGPEVIKKCSGVPPLPFVE